MNSNNPKISIILPFYNAEKFIAETIKSLINQSFQNYELIAIDDNSSDKSTHIVENYAKKDKRIKLIKNIGRKGLVGALNTGLLKAKGKYIARADADDIYLHNRLKDQYQYLESHPHIALLGTAYEIYDSKKKIILPQNGIEIAWNFLTAQFFCHPSTVFRRKIINKIGLYEDTAAEDFTFFSKIVQRFETANLKKVEIQYRIHKNNLSRINNDKIIQSGEETFQKNFIHYFGNTNNMDAFYNFRKNNLLKFSDLKEMINLEKRLLNKICKKYKKKIPIILSLKITKKFIKSLIKNLIINK